MINSGFMEKMAGKVGTSWRSYKIGYFLMPEEEKEGKTGLHEVSFLSIVKIAVQGKNKETLNFTFLLIHSILSFPPYFLYSLLF